MGDTFQARQLRAQLQAEMAMRQHRMLWEREVTAAAAHMGMDLQTYVTLVSLQHRDITPEDYDVLQCLDANVKPKTLEQSSLDELIPAWIVPTENGASSQDGGDAGFHKAPRTDEEQCYICLESYSPGQLARTLPCGHFYHADCIDEWLTSNSHECPVDHRPVAPAAGEASAASRRC